MLRVPVVASLLISAVVGGLFAWIYGSVRDDVSAVFTLSTFVAVTTYASVRMQAISMMERCTTSGMQGSLFMIMAFHNVGWFFGALLFAAGVFSILSPYLFKKYWERKMEEWDRAADYWKQRRLQRRKSTS